MLNFFYFSGPITDLIATQGKKVSSILGIKPGPKIGVILPEVMRWQLAHPDGTVEECGEFLKKMWNEKVKSVEG